MLAACGGAHGASSPSHSGDDGDVRREVIVEKTPYGTKTTVITHTTRTVDAPPPPPRPADPYPDATSKYNVERINAFRKHAGAPPLLYDARISGYALEGSKRLSRDHQPHAHFQATDGRGPGLGTKTAENQGDPDGVPAMDADPTVNLDKQIDALLKLMMDEGPGGGHHDNMLNPAFRRVGVGLHTAGGRLYLTNDFSN